MTWAVEVSAAAEKHLKRVPRDRRARLERAIDEMERAYRERDANVAQIRTDPMLDDLRGNPRFEKLVSQIVPANVR